MKNSILAILLLLFLSACNFSESAKDIQVPIDGPIQLHPANPHYFVYKRKTLALVTSAEHYGAVLNLDFDYKKYLETMAADGMNYTRIFTGTYFEIAGQSFNIQKNTLAPEPDRVITPWVKEESGMYDLTSWNVEYFKRLKDFMTLADEKDIIVEVTLFSSIYRDDHWEISPQNPANNINIDQEINRFDAQTLDNGDLYKHQESFVRKMVNELNGFNNFFFEIQNEPWSDHAVAVYNIFNKEELRKNDWTFKADFADERAMDWQEKIATIIAEEESKLDQKHLIAQNYTNCKASIPAVSDHISIINFHYAWPEAVEWNYHYNKVLGFDESGFAGPQDIVYRRQAWKFMLSGGGLFNNLDYSFFPGNEDGLGENNAPGGGSKALRGQLRILSEFLHSFELEKLYPDLTSVKSAPGIIPYVLSDKNKSYALFLRSTGTTKSTLQLKTGDGIFMLETVNTLTGEYSEAYSIEARDGIIEIEVDIPEGELGVRILRDDVGMMGMD